MSRKQYLMGGKKQKHFTLRQNLPDRLIFEDMLFYKYQFFSFVYKIFTTLQEKFQR